MLVHVLLRECVELSKRNPVSRLAYRLIYVQRLLQYTLQDLALIVICHHLELAVDMSGHLLLLVGHLVSLVLAERSGF